MARIFPDSKTFVDMPMRHKPIEILKKYAKLQMHHNGSPKRKDLEEFVHENFMHPGSEFEEWEPRDWRVNITLYETVKDRKYIDLAKFIHRRWKDLGRKIKSDVRENPERYSLIYMENPFVVPGGRFREVYYWDSYWTIKGLLLSEMYNTTKGMIQNFQSMIKSLGHIPNGNRVYYEKRSQPPLFTQIVWDYLNVTNNPQTSREFIAEVIWDLEDEFRFWTNRMVNVSVGGKVYQLARYRVDVDGPRPESYEEDHSLAGRLPEEKRKEWYIHMKSGAESGWDYSSRWFVTNKERSAEDELLDVQTGNILPVDLNSFLCRVWLGLFIKVVCYKQGEKC